MSLFLALGMSLSIVAQDVNKPIDEHGTTLLMQACEENDVIKVEELLGQGADVDQPDKDGFTALFYACGLHACDNPSFVINNNILISLLEHGANVNSHDNLMGWTAIFLLEEPNIDTAQLLIDYGANLNIVSESGVLLYETVIRDFDQEYIDFLVKNGANIQVAIQFAQRELQVADEWNKDHLHRAIASLKKLAVVYKASL